MAYGYPLLTTAIMLEFLLKHHSYEANYISHDKEERLKTVGGAANLFQSFRHMSAFLALGRVNVVKTGPVLTVW